MKSGIWVSVALQLSFAVTVLVSRWNQLSWLAIQTICLGVAGILCLALIRKNPERVATAALFTASMFAIALFTITR